MAIGILFEVVGLSKVAAALVWPFLILKPLMPCLPLGSPNCESDAFLSGTYREAKEGSMIELPCR